MALQFARLEQIQEMAEKLIGRISSLTTRVNTLEQTGGQPNLIERIFVNGFVVNPDENKDVKLTVPTKVNELENDAGFQENVIEKIKRNGLLLSIEDGKTVDISVPVNLSELINDANFQNGDEVKAAIQTAISKSGHASFQKVDAIPTAEEAQDNILYLVMNEETSHYDIYAKIGETMELLDDTTVDLSNYVVKETLNGYVAKVEGKDLSTHDFTTELLNKLNGIEENANHYTLDKQKVIAALGYTPGNVEEMTVTWDNVQNKPESYTPSAHSHTKSDISDFPTIPTSLPANGGTADLAKSVVDYGNTSSTIQIGYGGAGATTSNLSHIAGYLNGGKQIKDVSKDVLKSWLGTANSTNGFTFGAQSSDPGANSGLTTNKVLFVYE